MRIGLTGLNKYIKKTEKQKAQIKIGAANFVRKSVKAVLKDLVIHTPQWSGNTAASWKVDTRLNPAASKRSSLYTSDWKSLNPVKFRGDTEALFVALEQAEPVLKGIRYNTKVRIVNTSKIAKDIEAENIPLRAGNFIPDDAMAVKLVAAKYKLQRT